MRTTTFAPLAVFLVATTARAQEGPLGRVPNILTVDGVFGLATLHEVSPNSDGTKNSWAFGTLGTYPTTPTSLLRLGYHRVLGPITLGSSFYYGTWQGTSQLVLAPRLGFAIPAGTTTAVWPRLGVTYTRQASDFQTATQSYAAGELLIVITSMSHFGVMFGPFVEAGLSSTVTSHAGPFGTGVERSGDGPKYRLIGLTVGFLFDF